MGCFSWMFADTNNTKNLLINRSGYVACPDGSFIEVDIYGGYGCFDGHDVYELVVDWNRDFLKEIINKRENNPGKATREDFITDEFVDLVMKSDEKAQEYINAHIKPESYLRTDWKRNLGIYLACYDEDNATLPFPIKITEKTKIPYNELPPSDGDENQGFY